MHAESEYGATSLFHEQDVNLDEQFNFQESCLLQTDNQKIHPMQNNLQVQLSDADHGCKTALEGKIDFAFINQWIMSDEVEYQVNHIKDADTSDIYNGKILFCWMVICFSLIGLFCIHDLHLKAVLEGYFA